MVTEKEPTVEDLATLTMEELRTRASVAQIEGRSSMTKDELIVALEETEPEMEPEEPVEEPEEPVEEEPAEPEPDPTEGADPVEALTVERFDQVALLTINDHRFVLSATDVASARKALEVVGYELY